MMLELSDVELALLRELVAARLPGREVRAFGSRAKGRAKPHSDLDLVVIDDLPVADIAMAELRADLDESDLPFRVDLLRWSDAPDTLRDSIERASIPISM